MQYKPCKYYKNHMVWHKKWIIFEKLYEISKLFPARRQKINRIISMGLGKLSNHILVKVDQTDIWLEANECLVDEYERILYLSII